MTWGKMDDKFHRNRKVRALRKMEGGRAALGTWLLWWSWCLDDPEISGVVPADELSPTEERDAQLLVDVGLWEVVDGGYAFHDFHTYNPTREQIEAKREADRQRLAAKRGASRENVARDSHATKTRVASRARVPSRPDPDPDPRESTPPTLALVSDVDVRLAQLVRQRFERRFLEATASPPSWSKKNVDLCQAVAVWLEKKGGDPGRVLDQTLDGFFRDGWSCSKGFPLAHLANDPAKFFKPPERQRDVSTGFCAPAPSSAFVPTSPDSVFGPEPKS